ncbi:MAG: dihydroorotate dehydrogenase electron transfer subunit [Armatimonadota bacterium]
MKGIYECEILEHTQVAPGVVRTLLSGPQIAQCAEPGQFVNVRVAESTDPLLRRPLSVHGVYPGEDAFAVLYVIRGRGTQMLSSVPCGRSVSVVGPLGKPFDVGSSSEARHVLVGGGCGVAPLHFLCDVLCRRFGSDMVAVVTGAQTREALLCEGEFRRFGVDVDVCTEDGSYGFRGVVTDLLMRHLYEGSLPVRVYACGPREMLREVTRMCAEADVESCQVSLENFMACGLGVCLGCVQKVRDEKDGWHYERVCTEGPVFEARDVVWD